MLKGLLSTLEPLIRAKKSSSDGLRLLFAVWSSNASSSGWKIGTLSTVGVAGDNEEDVDSSLTGESGILSILTVPNLPKI